MTCRVVIERKKVKKLSVKKKYSCHSKPPTPTYVECNKKNDEIQDKKKHNLKNEIQTPRSRY